MDKHQIYPGNPSVGKTSKEGLLLSFKGMSYSSNKREKSYSSFVHCFNCTAQPKLCCTAQQKFCSECPEIGPEISTSLASVRPRNFILFGSYMAWLFGIILAGVRPSLSYRYTLLFPLYGLLKTRIFPLLLDQPTRPLAPLT
jgi:hypothetical protein